MARKRPSTPSIRARQRRILEYLFSVNKTFKEAAKDFGVTPRQLEKFVTTAPRDIRHTISRSNVSQDLFQQGTPQNLRPKARKQGTRLQRVQYEEAQIQVYRGTPGLPESEVNRRVQIGELIQRLYARRVEPRYLWAEWTREHNMPVSIKAARVLYRNHRMSYQDWINYTAVWQSIYGKDNETAEGYQSVAI